jgi:hypothetical protein
MSVAERQVISAAAREAHARKNAGARPKKTGGSEWVTAAVLVLTCVGLIALAVWRG